MRPDPLQVSPAHLARAQRWPIGQAVTVTKDDGSRLDTRLRCAPWRLGGTWVVMVEGISGGYALARVVERTEPAAEGERSVDDRQPKRPQVGGKSACV